MVSIALFWIFYIGGTVFVIAGIVMLIGFFYMKYPEVFDGITDKLLK